ncbi:MAG TPA: class I SAM-dependent methyltransferase [Gemmatimonadaceae bacterium]
MSRASSGGARRRGQSTSFAGAWLRTLTGSARALALSLPCEEARRAVVRLAREFGYDHRPGPANAPDDAIVHTLDLPASESPALDVDRDDVQFIRRSQAGVQGSRFRGTAEAARIRQLTCDSAAFDFAPYAGAMDFVFVDGAHAYDYVLSDSRAALQLAAPGAAIAWHDYGEWPDVTRALHDLAARDHRLRGTDTRQRHRSGAAGAMTG